MIDTPIPTPMVEEEIVMPTGFAGMGLHQFSLQAIADLGFGDPTPIQDQTIAKLLDGHDVIAQAPTGTGKTAAFGIPIVERLDEQKLAPQALVVVPTRELAIQVSEALHTLGKYREMVTLPIYGGQPYDRQLRALARGVQVVVGTPGRLLDHVRRETLDLSGISMVVLDEADEMLNMGFIEDIEAILSELPAQRQSALFSATIPPRIARLAEQFLRDPIRVTIKQREATTPTVAQTYIEVSQQDKIGALARLLDLEEPPSAIVFVRTRRDADEVAEQLNGLGYIAQAIHGEINQAQRERALDRFRAGRTQLLVATDVAARGLDIPDVSHVINYDLPLDSESYVHRVGRTGRAGKTGQAITLVTPRERRQLRMIEQAIRLRLKQRRLPTNADVAARRRTIFRDDLVTILDAGQLDPFIALVQDLSETREPVELAAAAFKMAAQMREASRPSHGETWLESLSRPANAEVVAEIEEAPEAENTAARRGRRRSNQQVARIFLRLGHQHGVRPANLVAAIANEAGIAAESIGDIDLYDAFSFVEVPEEDAQVVIDALNNTTIRGRSPRATLARPEGEQGGRERDGGESEGYRPRRFNNGPRPGFGHRGPGRPGNRYGGR